VALRIRRLAEENGVPVVENRPLARSLYSIVEIGDSIPDDFLIVIAGVYNYVNNIKKERLRDRSMGA
jgi:flagellar biosynthetic protein FlhB